MNPWSGMRRPFAPACLAATYRGGSIYLRSCCHRRCRRNQGAFHHRWTRKLRRNHCVNFMYSAHSKQVLFGIPACMHHTPKMPSALLPMSPLVCAQSVRTSFAIPASVRVVIQSSLNVFRSDQAWFKSIPQLLIIIVSLHSIVQDVLDLSLFL